MKPANNNSIALPKVADMTVYTMAQRSEVPCSKVRRQWRLRRQDLDSWMTAQVGGSGAPKQPEAKTKSSTRKGGARR